MATNVPEKASISLRASFTPKFLMWLISGRVAHTLLGSWISTYCCQTESPLFSNRLQSDKHERSLRYRRNLRDHPINKQRRARAEFQSHFRQPLSVSFPPSVTSNLKSLTCWRWFASEQQEARAAAFTQRPVRPVGSLFVTAAICTAERKYSWSGHQEETHTCAC